MLASAVLQFALIHTTPGNRFILSRWTIDFLVAHLRVWNAHSAAAIELGGGVTTTKWGFCNGCENIILIIHRNVVILNTHSGHTILTTIQFVASVRTVRFARTHQMTRNACAVLALELIRPTGDVLTVGRTFVVTVWAIITTVAQPTGMDACNTVVAEVFGAYAGGGWTNSGIATL